MTQKSLKKNAVLNFIRAFLNMAFPVITFPYASRVLMPQGVGAINFANSIIDYFLLIAGLGIASYATREAARIKNNKKRLNEFFKDIFSLNMISTAFAYVLFILAFFAVSKLKPYRTLLLICSAKILFTAVGINWLYTAFEEYGYITTRQAVFQAASLVILFIFVRKPEDVYAYAFMGVFSNVGANIINFLYARKFVNLSIKTKIHLRKHIKHILVFFGINCATKFHTALDAVMLGFMMDNVAVGLYSASYKVNRLVTNTISYVVSTFLPRSSFYFKEKMVDDYERLVENSLNMTFFFGLSCTAGLFLLSKPVLTIFCGSAYSSALPAMQVLTPFVAITSLSSVMDSVIIIPQRKEKIGLISQIVGSVLNFALNIPMIRMWGVFGAAFATTIVGCVILIIQMPVSWRYIVRKKTIKHFLQSVSGVIVMSVCVKLVLHFTEQPALQLVFSVVSGAVVFGFVMVLLKNEIALMLLNAIKSRFCRQKSRKR